MKIKKLTASVHQYPVYLPIIEKPLEHRVFTFCEVETDEGHKGCGVTGAFLPWSIVMALKHDILPLIKDMDPRDTEAIHDKIWWSLNPRAYTGVISNALAALDIALWDIKGKQAGRSIAQLLGGYRDWVGTYITFGYPFFDRDQLVEYAKKFISEGNTRLKMVVACDKGGYTESQKAAHLAQVYNLPIANGGGWPIFNMHTMAGCMNGMWAEFHWGMWQAGQRFFNGSPGPENNQVKIPKKPGLGFEPNYDTLRDSVVENPENLMEAGMQTNLDVITKA